MFTYYGSKSKIVHVYPPPKYDKIIEPFAGSARYSLRFWYKDILLIDKFEGISKAWEYLIKASRADILGLPRLKTGDNIDNFSLSDGEKYLLSFLVSQGTTGRKTMTSRSNELYDKQIKNIADNIWKVKNWKIVKGSYESLENIEATWFIDPPYKFGGSEYKESNKNIDFENLAIWCKSRKGQAIVCENTKADWLKFKPMITMEGQVHKTTEAIWSNIPTNFDNIQQTFDF